MNQITTRKTTGLTTEVLAPVLSARLANNLSVARNGLYGGKLLPGYGVTDDERREIQAHADRLRSYIGGGQPADIAKAISGIFLALTPRSDDMDGARARVAAYVGVLAPMPTWAVQKAVSDFLKGAVGDGKWCPTAVELYKQAGRYVAHHQDMINRIDELLAAKPSEKPDKATRAEAVSAIRSQWGIGETRE